MLVDLNAYSKKKKDMWKIPLCYSNWKNRKGKIVPIERRVNSFTKLPPLSDTFFKPKETTDTNKLTTKHKS